jgi:hypothetical protein
VDETERETYGRKRFVALLCGHMPAMRPPERPASGLKGDNDLADE